MTQSRSTPAEDDRRRASPVLLPRAAQVHCARDMWQATCMTCCRGVPTLNEVERANREPRTVMSARRSSESGFVDRRVTLMFTRRTNSLHREGIGATTIADAKGRGGTKAHYTGAGFHQENVTPRIFDMGGSRLMDQKQDGTTVWQRCGDMPFGAGTSDSCARQWAGHRCSQRHRGAR